MTTLYYTGTETIPEGTTKLYCCNNQLTELPPLPEGLDELCCTGCPLTSLPTLSASLRILTCYDCHLTELPPLPESLRRLECNNNQLTELPPLPESLIDLICYGNPLPFAFTKDNLVDVKLWKQKQEISEVRQLVQTLINEIKELKEEFSLIPEYGKNYFKAKEQFEEHTKEFK